LPGGRRGHPEHLQPVVIPRDYDEIAASGAANGLNVSRLALEHEAAFGQIDWLEPSAADAMENEAVTGVIAAEHRGDPELVSRQEEVRATVAIEISCQRGRHGRELRLDGKRLERESAVPVIQRDRRREIVRLEDRGSCAIRRRENVLDPASTKVGVRWKSLSKSGHGT
jgi:hypothetical protein